MTQRPNPTAPRDHVRPLPQSPGDRLPRPLTSFLGRDAEIDRILALLGQDDVRLVTLTGPGGAGKTRLAIQAGRAALSMFPAGVTFVALAPIRDAAHVPAAIAAALGAPDTGGGTTIERICRALGEHAHLLVIDNLEHLPAAADILTNLLTRAPELTLLCTSRSRLGISGEHLAPVEPLDHTSAASLFIERARAVEPSFVVTPETEPVVAAICARLDGLPLAIELAAARVPILPPSALLARLRQPLAVLTGGPRDAPAHQQTMRATIAWSYDLLDPAGQEMLRHLAVFVGGFTLDAASAMLDNAPDVLDRIAALQASNLIRRVTGRDDQPRYLIAETIREFALEALVAHGEDAAARDRHAGYFMHLAESILPGLDGPAVYVLVSMMQAELDNCRVALTWALQTADYVMAARLSGAIYRVWWHDPEDRRRLMDAVAEGRQWMERALAHRDGLPVDALSEALAGLATFACFQHDYAAANAWGHELLDRAEAEQHPWGQFWALLVLGDIDLEQGTNGFGEAWFQRALTLTPHVRDPDNQVSNVRIRLGQVATRQGDLQLAEKQYRDGIAHADIAGNVLMLGGLKMLLGDVLLAQGRLVDAADVLVELVTSAELYLVEFYDRGGALALVARIAQAAAQPERSVSLLSAAISMLGHYEPPALAEAERAIRAAVPPDVFAPSWERGRRFAWDDIVHEVEAMRDELQTPAASRADPPSHGLTARQVDVLRLLVEGHTNRDIADQLSISLRTAENHVLEILSRLGVSSRTAAATWAVRHGIGGDAA